MAKQKKKRNKSFDASKIKTLPSAKSRFQNNAAKGKNMAMQSKSKSAPRHPMFRRKAG